MMGGICHSMKLLPLCRYNLLTAVLSGHMILIVVIDGEKYMVSSLGASSASNYMCHRG